MSAPIQMRLSTDSIENAIKEIRDYKKSLKKKCTLFVEKLADCGISVAVQNGGKYGRYITFGKKVVEGNAGSYAIMYGSSGTILETWLLENDVLQGAEITPILMAEFGSGKKASDAAGLPNANVATSLGMGRGTFFDSGNYLREPKVNHAFQNSWSWQDVNGEWHSSSGEEPTMPMFKAGLEMRLQILKIAREVFGG